MNSVDEFFTPDRGENPENYRWYDVRVSPELLKAIHSQRVALTFDIRSCISLIYGSQAETEGNMYADESFMPSARSRIVRYPISSDAKASTQQFYGTEAIQDDATQEDAPENFDEIGLQLDDKYELVTYVDFLSNGLSPIELRCMKHIEALDSKKSTRSFARCLDDILAFEGVDVKQFTPFENRYYTHIQDGINNNRRFQKMENGDFYRKNMLHMCYMLIMREELKTIKLYPRIKRAASAIANSMYAEYCRAVQVNLVSSVGLDEEGEPVDFELAMSAGICEVDLEYELTHEVLASYGLSVREIEDTYDFFEKRSECARFILDAMSAYIKDALFSLMHQVAGQFGKSISPQMSAYTDTNCISFKCEVRSAEFDQSAEIQWN